MKRIMILSLMCLMLVFTAEAQSPQREDIEIIFKKAEYIPYQDEYEQMLYPTVRISSVSGTGSGVIFNHKDILGLLEQSDLQPSIPGSIRLKPNCQSTKEYIYILTACHVVDKENTVNIELYNSAIITGTVVITDTIKDLALITPQINTDSKIRIYTAKLAPRDYKAYLFSPVWAVGCSLGLKPRPSFGYLCALGDSVADNWEVSCPILPGNSGGPVYDAHTYEVIGIAVWVKVYQGQLVTTMAGIVPINQIYEFLKPQITQIDTDD
jgi:S1-C subfamily serine protease